MRRTPGIILIGSSVSMAFTLVMWALKAMPVLIWFTLPGWILVWTVTAALLPVGIDQWRYFDVFMVSLLTVSNAAFYSWALYILSVRTDRAQNQKHTSVFEELP